MPPNLRDPALGADGRGTFAPMRTPHVMPALVTPFDGDGAIDFDAHRHNVETLTERGIHGFVIAGSTGEGPYLDPGERGALVTATRDALGDEPFILCGVAAESVRQAAAAIAEAEISGANAALVMTPTSLVRNDHDAVVRFYEQVADASDLPIFLYSVPRVTGYELPIDAAVRLAARPGIAGMKDSGGNPVRVQQLAAAASDFPVFCGSSQAVGLAVAGGGRGAITSSANYAPTLVREVARAARKSLERADEPQERLTGLSRLVEARGLPGVKLAARVAGLRPGFPRAPLAPLPAAEAEQLERSLAALRLQLLG